MRRVAELTDQFATGVGHVTTRQDIQLHFVELTHVSEMMRLLAAVGLTTREASHGPECHCLSPGRGLPGEVFDVTPYAKTVAYHLLRNPLNQSMPRKFKIALSGCRQDCALTPIHDIGLLAAKRADGTRLSNGGGRRTGFDPADGPGAQKSLRRWRNCCRASRRSSRCSTPSATGRIVTKARMKFVIEKLGAEEFNVGGK